MELFQILGFGTSRTRIIELVEFVGFEGACGHVREPLGSVGLHSVARSLSANHFFRRFYFVEIIALLA